MHTLYFLVALLLVSPILSSGVIASTFTTTQTGSGTYYGPTTGGNCGFGTLLPSFVASQKLTQVALNAAQYAGDYESGGCGLCIQMEGTGTGSGAKPISKTPFIAFVEDDCPGCDPKSIDLAVTGDGKWGITWKGVACPVGSEKLKYKFQGSNPYYLKVQVVAHKLPLSKVQFKVGSTLYTATRTQDNFWLATGVPTPIAFPLTILCTATSGEVVTDSIPSLTNDVLLQGKAQFTGSTGAEVTDQMASTSGLDPNVYIGIGIGCAVGVIVLIVVVVVLVKRTRAAQQTEIA